jgi:hypothetical protein
VSQIYGKKRWIIFPKSDSIYMRYNSNIGLTHLDNKSLYLSPSRIPFEESTVYSQINIKEPDLNKFKEFKV